MAGVSQDYMAKGGFPINSLPTELISNIFFEGLQTSRALSSTLEGVKVNNDPYEELRARNMSVTKYLNHITSVSSSLRQIALGDTRLWAVIVWVGRQKAPSDHSSAIIDCARVDAYLERSQNAMLRVVIIDCHGPPVPPGCKAVWKTLLPHIHHCVSQDYMAKGGFPINSLPTELISNIFFEGLQTSRALSSTLEGVKVKNDPYEELRARNMSVTKYLNHITSVSSSLRQIALGDTRLWAVIVWVGRQKAPSDDSSAIIDCARVNAYLERSQNAMLRVVVIDCHGPPVPPGCKAVWKTLLPHIHHCKQLSIVMPKLSRSRLNGSSGTLDTFIPFPMAMPCLELLTLSGTVITRSDTVLKPQENNATPSLQTLKVDLVGSAHKLLKSFTPFCTTLREAVFVDTASVSEVPIIYDIINLCASTLEKLKIEYPASFIGPSEPIVLPHLVELTIASDLNFSFRGFLLSPRLKRLQVLRKDPYQSDDVHPPTNPFPRAHYPCSELAEFIIRTPPSNKIGWVESTFLPFLEDQSGLKVVQVYMSRGQTSRLVHYLADPAVKTSSTDEPSATENVAGRLIKPHPLLQSLTLVHKTPRLNRPSAERDLMTKGPIDRLMKTRPVLCLTVDASLIYFETEEEKRELRQDYGERLKLRPF
ncbi:hypothetical protein DL93DRAFT_2100464 [Clavulina sp. PMI_390]|nr:hypothetical protein DL93DRAFT_2100464 [Clavulina sp. PMI_390]